jgi:hypothetical protein
MGFFDRAASNIKSEVQGIVTDAKDAINGVLKPKARAKANFDSNDYRTILKVPAEYLSFTQSEAFDLTFAPLKNLAIEETATEAVREAALAEAFDSLETVQSGITSALKSHGGIIFPFTPTISYDNKANYSEQNVMHSNFTQYFYKNSSVSSIRIEGKFTVQTPAEGVMLLATIHLLRSLTKMRFGNDPLAGSPPPICRLNAYGDYMLKNVPVSVASFTHNLPDNVDYITVGKYGSMVPVLSTISIELNVMYSRQEMFDHNVPAWITGSLTGKGYL